MTESHSAASDDSADETGSETQAATVSDEVVQCLAEAVAHLVNDPNFSPVAGRHVNCVETGLEREAQ